jgi:DNA repair exonuclease SbcCD nuclease subunit
MSKFLLFTDLHLDNWNAYSTTLSNGYNSRLAKQIQLLDNLLMYAKKNVDYVVFAGDLFNRRLLVPTDVLHLAFETFSDYPDTPIYLLVGNHDMYDNNPTHTILSVFREFDNVFVISRDTTIYFQPQTHVTLVPYGISIPAASTKLDKDAYQILVTHYGLAEAKLGPSNFRMESDLTVKKIREFGYDLSLFGHIHKAQALTDQIVVLGSAMAHSFHEAGEPKFFYVFDGEDRSLVKYPTNAPEFLVHNVNSEEEFYSIDTQDGNYHRINILTPKITFDDVKNYTDTNVIISFSYQSQYTYTGEAMESIESRGPKQEVGDYYDSLDTELEKDRLKKDSLRIIEEI